MSTEGTNITKLDKRRNNYFQWSIQLIGTLRVKELWTVVSTPDLAAAGYTAENSKAVGYLMASLGGTEGRYIDPEIDTAAEMWAKLKLRHRSQLASDRLIKEKILKALRKSSQVTMSNHIDSWLSLKHDYE
jgi:hypothetical protein